MIGRGIQVWLCSQAGLGLVAESGLQVGFVLKIGMAIEAAFGLEAVFGRVILC